MINPCINCLKRCAFCYQECIKYQEFYEWLALKLTGKCKIV